MSSRIFHGVFHAGAAAVLDADAHAGDGLFRPRHHVLNAQRRGIGQAHHLGSGPWRSPWQSSSLFVFI